MKNDIIELEFLHGENSGKLRITDVQKGWTGGRCIRINVAQVSGKLLQGPEIPIETIPDFIRAIESLIK